jgi:hypothetical protein
MTSALDRGEWSASCPSHALPQEKGSAVPIGQEARWAPEVVWTQAKGKIVLPLLGIEPQSPGCPVHRHYTDVATLATTITVYTEILYQSSALKSIQLFKGFF